MNREVLKNQILSLTDQTSENFVGFPNNSAEAADNWASVFNEYLNGTPLSFIPGSDTLNIGLETLRGMLLQINEPLKNGETMFVTGLVSMAAAIAPGISTKSSGAFTGVPPVGQPILSPIFQMGIQNLFTAEQIADALAAAIDSWLKTGTYINNESGAILFWQ